MFGFGRLGSYNYFAHVERELAVRFASAGHELVAHVIDDLPTASIRSQLWGTLVWAGLGDHLDVLGHHRDDRDPSTVPPERRHRDWLTSGSDFSHAAFAELMDAIVTGMLNAC
jgi:hypothetical protein